MEFFIAKKKLAEIRFGSLFLENFQMDPSPCCVSFPFKRKHFVSLASAVGCLCFGIDSRFVFSYNLIQ